jgi:hypothetical protein
MPLDPFTGLPCERPPVKWGCSICGAEVPRGQRHDCLASMTPRQRRRVEAQRRLTQWILNREKRPRPCEYCGVDQTPGRVHACRVRPLDKAAAAAEAYQTAGLVAHLKELGFVVEPKGSQDD